MFQLRATFQLNTPAFIGGANPSDPTELRIEAILGQLRRWWWARAPIQPGLLSEGARHLFGASGGAEAGGGQGKFVVKIGASTVASIVKTNAIREKNIENLYGPLWSRRKHVLWIMPDGQRPVFDLEFCCSPANYDERLAGQLVATLRLWGLLGGLGSGARRGFGSVQLLRVTAPNIDIQPPATAAAYREAILDALGLAGSDVISLPVTARNQKFGAFTRGEVIGAGVRAVAIPDARNGIEALAWIADALNTFRYAQPGAGAINVLSQPVKSGRIPSPYHQHVAMIDNKPFYIVTTLSTEGWDGIAATNVRDVIEGPEGLFNGKMGTKSWLP